MPTNIFYLKNMQMKNILIIVTLRLLSAASCKKDKASEDQLPPATQTGANTFGCLVNGKVFVPKGYDGTGRPNPHVQYDYDLNGQPYFSIETNLFVNSNSQGGVLLVFRNLNSTRYYSINNDLRFTVGWPQVLSNCGGQTLDTTVKSRGGGTITKLDISNQIISGTFDFKYKTQICDTVFVTDGRFDIKF